MICSHSCPCWDLKGERLHIHYCLPENLILRGIGIVSFVSYYNSLITNDSVDLNTGKRSSTIRSALNTRQLELLCCSRGTQVPFPPMSHMSHHQSHSADFIKEAAEFAGEGRKRGMSPCSTPVGSLGAGFSPRCSSHIPGKPLPQYYALRLLDLEHIR